MKINDIVIPTVKFSTEKDKQENKHTTYRHEETIQLMYLIDFESSGGS
jgi:hypothetical protein